MHSLWSTWTINVVHTQHTFVNCYASHGTLEGGPNESCWWQWTVPHVKTNTQAHTGRRKKVTGRIWEGTGWAPLTLRNTEQLKSFQLSLVLYWECTFLPGSSCLHEHFYTCLVPIETRAIRHLTKQQTLFSLGVRVDFWYSKSVVFNPISCFE